jgi:16S rRNA (uracil1498-N3)-methyltransferase
MSLVPSALRAEDRVAVLVGPEGGWTDRERAQIAAARWAAVSLGPQILRAETAGIAGLSIIVAAWMGGLGH